MTDQHPKRAILATLRLEPDFSALVVLPALDTQPGRDFQRWLDWSGLALTFWHQLQSHNATSRVSEQWRSALERRRTHNIERMRDMLLEAQRLHDSFRSRGVRAASLKGFTLAPDFCDDSSLRHQVDFDFLVDPGSVDAAADALQSYGYSTAHLNKSAETCFVTPSQHIPSANDDLYGIQRQRQVDLHVSVWEVCSWLPVEAPTNCLEHASLQTILGVELLSLSLEDKFLVQVLHAFRHSFRSWIRVSWILEIARCLENHRNNTSLWNQLIARAGSTRLTKSIFAFVLGLSHRLFDASIPSSLHSWTSVAMTKAMRAWLDHFAVDWALSNWPGSLNNLFLSSEFIPDPSMRRQYWRSRLLPKKANASIGVFAPSSPFKSLHLQVARLNYLAHRAAAHLTDIAALPRQQLRWKRALQLSQRAGFDGNC